MQFKGFILAMLGTTLAGLHSLNAQAGHEETRIRVHTVMEHYAPEYVLAPEERRRLKNERHKDIAARRAVIDTLDISRRKKRRLLRELYNTPFSDEYQEVLSNLLPEDGEEIVDEEPD
jgi:hypothetical protein